MALWLAVSGQVKKSSEDVNHVMGVGGKDT